MANPFEVLAEKLDLILREIAELKSIQPASPQNRIPAKQFCKEHDITRHTLYRWNAKRLIKTEKISGRLYVLADSVSVKSKFQRSLLD